MRIVARKPTGTTLPEEKERRVERANINNISTVAKEGTGINCLEIGIRPPTPSRKSAIMPAETHLCLITRVVIALSAPTAVR
jgi:hypothetical protein